MTMGFEAEEEDQATVEWQHLRGSLEMVASELVTALGIGREHLQGGGELMTIVEEWQASETNEPTLLTLNALHSTVEAIQSMGGDWLISESVSYCITADPPSLYFRLGDIETCSHRPDHPR